MVTEKQKNVIDAWLTEVMRKGTWPDHDLHIDRINPRLKKEPSVWLEKGFEYFTYARSRGNKNGFSAVLLIFLKDARHSQGLASVNIEELRGSDFSHTPPSIYLLQENHEKYSLITSEANKQQLRYQQFKYGLNEWFDSEDNVYRRTLVVV